MAMQVSGAGLCSWICMGCRQVRNWSDYVCALGFAAASLTASSATSPLFMQPTPPHATASQLSYIMDLAEELKVDIMPLINDGMSVTTASCLITDLRGQLKARGPAAV